MTIEWDKLEDAVDHSSEVQRDGMRELVKHALYSHIRTGATPQFLDSRFAHVDPAVLSAAIAELKAEGKIRDKTK